MNQFTHPSTDTFFNPGTEGCLDDFGCFLPEAYEWSRPTVAVALMQSNRLLLVQSSKRQPDEDPSWLLPQGGVDKGVDIYVGAERELWQELHLEFTTEKLKLLQEQKMFQFLGWYVNPPRSEGGLPKLIMVVGIQVETLCHEDIVLNDENIKVVFVNGQFHLWTIMGHTRSHKVLGTCHAINEAEWLGMIRWSCHDVIAQIPESVAA